VRSRTGERAHARWVYGINAVARRVSVHPDSVSEVHVLDTAAARVRSVAAAAAQRGIPVREVDAATLHRVVGTREHQGVAALTEPFHYADLEAVLARGARRLLVVDHIQDPHNLGALIRTAAATGMAAVALPRDGAVGITPAVEKAAAGTVNDIPVCRVVNVSRLLRALQDHGVWTLALVPHGAGNLLTMEIPQPTALVVGGEAGLRPLVERNCDLRASIPVCEPVESLNASVAGAIAMYEVFRREGLGEPLSEPPRPSRKI